MGWLTKKALPNGGAFLLRGAKHFNSVITALPIENMLNPPPEAHLDAPLNNS
jgi:hypothetical protein